MIDTLNYKEEKLFIQLSNDAFFVVFVVTFE